ncbi:MULTISPECIES: TIGR00730 family Rossman fold protein [Acinetobacter]|uniref:LOG family protein n=1 Tax=Acinetobacter TaxID=469 RepID=UPI002005E0ED|nr:TIGR00730 family Rossman fold protein [Acinetobacter radioresistens]MCK4081483.1 TIGR00730 family Rossman fold protein [Acinetobacter radioresistens]MCU4500720.1 TIGR00730 family Rossman fold protein [Acinetobacter radioresistens]
MMNSVLEMRNSPVNPEPRTTQHLVALYCGSRPGNNTIYREKAIELSQGLAQHGFGIVYGGASIGLMGQVADSVLEAGGEVVGVIPEFMLDYEIAHNQLTELHIVASMHERKALMAERASAFVALPGGLGTFEEILEIATWGQLNQHQKPMILYNVNGFYNALINQLDHAVQEGFLPAQHRAKIVVCEHSKAIFNAMKNLNSPSRFAI